MNNDKDKNGKSIFCIHNVAEELQPLGIIHTLLPQILWKQVKQQSNSINAAIKSMYALFGSTPDNAMISPSDT